MKNGVAVTRIDGSTARAVRVEHLRTLTGGRLGRSYDLETYRLASGELIECMTPTHDCRVRPKEVKPENGAYPGFPAGA